MTVVACWCGRDFHQTDEGLMCSLGHTEQTAAAPLCRCGHDHKDPPWRKGDEGICNATMGPMICGCSEYRVRV